VKVAFIVTGGLHPSGREQIIPAIVTLISHLTRDCEVHAFALRHLEQPATYSLGGATIHDLGRPEGRIRQWRSLSREMQRVGGFHVVHGYWADPAGLHAAIVGRQFNVPSVITCDSGEFTSLPQIGYGLQRSLRTRAVVSAATRLATSVHVTTTFMSDLASSLGVATSCIPLGIDVSRFPFTDARPAGPPWRLLQVASLSRVKDQETLLRALALVRRTADVSLDLVGEDTLGGELQRLAAALGLSDHVAFHGFVHNDALAPFHRRSHLYVQSSLHESAGVSVLEAAAAGVPVVGTDVGFVGDWRGRAAIAVPPGSHEALGTAILDLLKHPDRGASIARAARAWVEEHDASYTARALGTLYQAIGSATRPER
jgi:glycosyltransferase involved in cell wall biosynthesis